MDFVTLEMPCPTCGRGPAPGVLRNAATGQPQKCPNCGGAAVVPIPCQRQPFDYAFPNIDVDNPIVELQLDDDSYFELDSYVVSGPSGVPTVQLSDLSTGWQFSNAPLMQGDGFDDSNFAGTALEPAPLLVPFTFPPGTVLQLATGTVIESPELQVTLKGYKLYPLVDPDTMQPTGGMQGAAGKAA